MMVLVVLVQVPNGLLHHLLMTQGSCCLLHCTQKWIVAAAAGSSQTIHLCCDDSHVRSLPGGL